MYKTFDTDMKCDISPVLEILEMADSIIRDFTRSKESSSHDSNSAAMNMLNNLFLQKPSLTSSFYYDEANHNETLVVMIALDLILQAINSVKILADQYVTATIDNNGYFNL